MGSKILGTFPHPPVMQPLHAVGDPKPLPRTEKISPPVVGTRLNPSIEVIFGPSYLNVPADGRLVLYANKLAVLTSRVTSSNAGPTLTVNFKFLPIPDSVLQIIENTKYIVTLEESNIEGGSGSEIISSIVEKTSNSKHVVLRIGSENVPIPSTRILQTECLINVKKIIKTLGKIL